LQDGGASRSHRLSSAGQLSLTRATRETSFEFALERDKVKTSPEAAWDRRQKEDVLLTQRQDVFSPASYLLIAPRYRRSTEDVYRDLLSLRVGAGYRWQPHDDVRLIAELATGARRARLNDGSSVREPVYTSVLKARWQISPSLQLRANGVVDQARTGALAQLDLSLRVRLTAALSGLIRLEHERTPAARDAGGRGERQLEVGLAYEL
jgi:putative salt-induced outer membrane protein YdiY